MMTAGDTASLGSRLRKARERAGLSRRQLSTRVDVDPAYIGRLESGKRAHPSMELLLKIAAATHTDAGEFLEPLGVTIAPILPSTRDFFRQKFDVSADEA